MTVSSTTRKAGPYIGNGVTPSFPFTFKVFSASDVLVVRADATGAETTLALTADYMVSLNADQNASPGGTVTPVVVLDTGLTLTISSQVDYLQPVDLTNNGGFYPAVINTALDRLTILAQQLLEKVGRSLKMAISAQAGVDPTLPTPVPYQVIGWNGTGTGFQNTDPTYSTALATDLANGTNASKGVALVAGANRVVSTIAALKALPKTGSPTILVTGYYAAGDGGGGIYYYDATDTTSADNGGTIIVATDGGRWKLVDASRVTVKQFGAKGDGVTDDTAAIQACTDANSVIYYPTPSSFYKVTSIQSGGTSGTGNKIHVGTYTGLNPGGLGMVRGSGAASAFKTGIYPSGNSSLNRQISFFGMSVSNTNYPAIELLTAINFEVDRCNLSTTTNTTETLKIRMSYRGRVENCSITCSGGGWAVTAFDNCNGVRIQGNITTGGSDGGAIHVEQSQGVSVNRNIIESSKYGIAIATGIDPINPSAGNVVGAGNVNGFECINNYLEVVTYPFFLGYGDGTSSHPGQSIYGASIKDNYVANSTGVIDGYIAYIGRLNGSEISNNSFYRLVGGAVAALYFSYATGAATPWAQNNRIVNNPVFNGSGAFLNYDNTVLGGPTYPGLIGALYGENEIQTQLNWSSSGSAVSSAPSGLRTWVSDKITANVGLAQIAFDPTLTGGVVHSVEILEKTGNVASTVYVGSSVSVGEIWGTSGFDPSMIVDTLGCAKVPIGSGGTKYIRAGVPPAFRVVAGAGTGTFRVRIRYQAA